MTCAFVEGGGKMGLFHEQMQALGDNVEVKTGGVDSGTLVFVKGKLSEATHTLVGKVKPWSGKGEYGFGIYGNGASVTLNLPDHPFVLKVTNLPKIRKIS